MLGRNIKVFSKTNVNIINFPRIKVSCEWRVKKTHKRWEWEGKEQTERKSRVVCGVPQQQVVATWRGWYRPPNSLQVLPETPYFALYMPVGQRWHRQCDIERGWCTRRRYGMEEEPVSKTGTWDIAFVGGHARIDIPKSIRTSATTKNLLTFMKELTLWWFHANFGASKPLGRCL